MKVSVYIEGERLDLFQDESISITQGVQDVRDISKLFADFSQSFNVPASDNNNRIFKHYYNADIDGGFDARTRKLANIDINTLDFKRGKIQLESVKIKDNRPSSYKVTFFGNAIKIKDLLGDDKLFNLEWLENFDHPSSGADIKDALINGIDFTVDGTLYERAIVYPLISYKRQYLYNSNSLDQTSEEKLVNIAYDVGRTDGVVYNELKPAIKLAVIVEAINRKYGFNFTGGFFDTLDYQELFVPLNSETSITSGFLEVENITGSGGFTPLNFQDVYAYGVLVTPKAGFENVGYKVKLEVNGGVVYEDQQFLSGTRNPLGTTSVKPDTFSARCTITTNESFEFDIDTELVYATLESQTTLFLNNYLNQVVTSQAIIKNLIYDIKVYDFLTSLFKMFNLVVVADGEDLLVKDLQTWYSEGEIYNISKWVDTKSLTVEKGKIYNEFNFRFEESEQILANEFQKNNRRYYGNLELKLYADQNQTTLLDGDSLDVDVVFERPINERLINQGTGNLTNIQYCLYLDDNLDEITGNPFLIYCDSQTLSGNSIGFVDESGTYSEISSFIFMPSQNRSLLSANSFSVNFNAELSEFTYQLMTDNIFSKYYADYIGDIFSIKRRSYKLECILPSEILHNLKLNDRIIINDRRYIINKIKSNLVDRKDSFELINDIYDAPLASDIINSGFRTQGKLYSSSFQSDTAQYIGNSTVPAKLVDIGDGTTWVTITNDPQTTIRTIEFSLDENTGTERKARIEIANISKSASVFNIIQTGIVSNTFDNTFDTTFK